MKHMVPEAAGSPAVLDRAEAALRTLLAGASSIEDGAGVAGGVTLRQIVQTILEAASPRP